jgi:hypothetical protein
MFSKALSHVQNCYKALLIFASIIAGFMAIRVGVETWIIERYDLDDSENLSQMFMILFGIGTALIYALAQALAFPLLGEYIERPVWKARREPGAFARFFAFWFTLDLLSVASIVLISISPADNSSKASMLFLWTMLQTIVTPFGAAVMFFGNTTRREISQAGNTMIAQLPSFALLCLMYYVLISIVQSISFSLPAYLLPFSEIITAYTECFVFAYTWEICRRHRELEENMDDLDY